MHARTSERITLSQTDEAFMFGEAVQRLVQMGQPLAHMLTMLASMHPTDLADATALARDFVSLSQRGYTPIESVVDEW